MKGEAMHTQDLENHDNLYANEVLAVAGENPAVAKSHVLWAIVLLAASVIGLGLSIAVF